MITIQLKEYLDSRGIKYTTTQHSQAFTAMEVAEAAHVSGKQMAKVVIMKKDDQPIMAVLPANYHINSKRMTEVLHATSMEVAQESDFEDKFFGCELGAMPPFGNLYSMDTYVAEGLAKQEHITFNAGTHSDVVTMRLDDYLRLAKPTILSFTDRTHPV